MRHRHRHRLLHFGWTIMHSYQKLAKMSILLDTIHYLTLKLNRSRSAAYSMYELLIRFIFTSLLDSCSKKDKIAHIKRSRTQWSSLEWRFVMCYLFTFRFFCSRDFFLFPYKSFIPNCAIRAYESERERAREEGGRLLALCNIFPSHFIAFVIIRIKLLFFNNFLDCTEINVDVEKITRKICWNYRT